MYRVYWEWGCGRDQGMACGAWVLEFGVQGSGVGVPRSRDSGFRVFRRAIHHKVSAVDRFRESIAAWALRLRSLGCAGSSAWNLGGLENRLLQALRLNQQQEPNRTPCALHAYGQLCQRACRSMHMTMHACKHEHMHTFPCRV